MRLQTVARAHTPADLVTKHLNVKVAMRHPKSLDMWVGGGRAAFIPTCSALTALILDSRRV